MSIKSVVSKAISTVKSVFTKEPTSAEAGKQLQKLAGTPTPTGDKKVTEVRGAYTPPKPTPTPITPARTGGGGGGISSAEAGYQLQAQAGIPVSMGEGKVTEVTGKYTPLKEPTKPKEAIPTPQRIKTYQRQTRTDLAPKVDEEKISGEVDKYFYKKDFPPPEKYISTYEEAPSFYERAKGSGYKNILTGMLDITTGGAEQKAGEYSYKQTKAESLKDLFGFYGKTALYSSIAVGGGVLSGAYKTTEGLVFQPLKTVGGAITLPFELVTKPYETTEPFRRQPLTAGGELIGSAIVFKGTIGTTGEYIYKRGKLYYDLSKYEKMLKESDPVAYQEYIRQKKLAGKVDNLYPVKDIDLTRLEVLEDKPLAQEVTKQVLKENKGRIVVGGSIGSETQIYEVPTKRPADIDVYVKGSETKVNKIAEKFGSRLKETELKNVEVEKGKVYVDGKKYMEFHQYQSYLKPNIEQVTPIYKPAFLSITKTPEGIKVPKIELQLKRKIVGGYLEKYMTGKIRLKDIPYANAIEQSLLLQVTPEKGIKVTKPKALNINEVLGIEGGGGYPQEYYPYSKTKSIPLLSSDYYKPSKETTIPYSSYVPENYLDLTYTPSKYVKVSPEVADLGYKPITKPKKAGGYAPSKTVTDLIITKEPTEYKKIKVPKVPEITKPLLATRETREQKKPFIFKFDFKPSEPLEVFKKPVKQKQKFFYIPNLVGIEFGKSLIKEPLGSKVFRGLEKRPSTLEPLSISPFRKTKVSLLRTPKGEFYKRKKKTKSEKEKEKSMRRMLAKPFKPKL